MKRLNQSDFNFKQQFSELTNDSVSKNNKDSAARLAKKQQIQQTVTEVISHVQQEGLSAVMGYTQKFDHWKPKNLRDLSLNTKDFKDAYDSLSQKEQNALLKAKKRITHYHQNQKIADFSIKDEFGNQVGQMSRPLKRVGIYVPGGTAAYPSSVFMNVLPAKVAGVSKIIMVVPTPNGKVNSMVLAAAYLSGVSIIYRIGGAQAIAALAYGIKNKTGNGEKNDTAEEILPVDKIVGPGNAYVAEAKRQVFGKVGIDMIAGPSEITIICDDSARVDWVCLDMFAQGEHDKLAQVIVISTSGEFLDSLEVKIKQKIKTQGRGEIIKQSLRDKGVLIQVKNLKSAIKLANKIAPEHLELAFNNASEWLEKIENAGAIFVGHYSAEVFGDYCAGPSHVLPTSATARFSSPLGVYDFIKRMSVIECSKKGSRELANIAEVIAEKEGLFAHRDSARARK